MGGYCLKYSKGSYGRVYIIKIEHGDDVLDGLKEMAKKEKIGTAIFFMIGAVKDAAIVSGSQKPIKPPIPITIDFNEGREVLGIGTMFSNDGGPVLHVHGVYGHDRDVLMGCLREYAETYLIMEVILLEVVGSGAFKKIDENGLMMLDFIK